jgi:tetratricopeptide (TPR) repeat protein
MAGFSRRRWPPGGPVRELLSYLDELHREAGRPSLTELGRAVALAPSTLSAFFTGARLINRGNLELVVEHLGGDVNRAEALRRRAVVAQEETAPPEVQPEDVNEDAGSRLDVMVFTQAGNRLNRPERLLGRSDLLDRLHQLTDQRTQTLLYGLGGAGKTALAATFADERVSADGRAYLWMRPGRADTEEALDAVVRTLATAPERDRIRSSAGDSRLLAIQDMIARHGIGLWVIDDVWRPETLHTLLRALPKDLPVVVTSRLKFGLAETIEVGRLPADDALGLLNLHAGRAHSAQARELCRDLGHHAYAIEIAGRHLRQYDTSPAELRRLLAHAPHDLAMPGGLAAAGRESLHRLLDSTFSALDDADARAALGMMGALSAGTAGVELLSACLGFSTGRTQNALHRLVDVSLAKRVESSSVYELHDLTYSFARTLGVPAPIEAVAVFTVEHAQEFSLLGADLDNLLGAAAEVQTTDPATFLTIIETLATGGFLDSSIQTPTLLRLLDAAIELVRDDPARCHMLLTKRGNADLQRGDFERAVVIYREALGLAPDPLRQATLLSVLGRTLAEVHRHDEAAPLFERAYAIADEIGDPRFRLKILEQHTVAAFRHEAYAEVRDVALEGLKISRELGARIQEAVFLNNLGTAEFEIGVRAAIEHHHQAQEIGVSTGNDNLIAFTHRTLGADYQALERFDDAREHFARALDLYVRLGQTEREASLRNLMRQFGYLKGEAT